MNRLEGKLNWFYTGVLAYHEFFRTQSLELKQKKIAKRTCEVIFTRNSSYLKFYASNHPKDFPPFFNIILGEGSTEFPESDWNSIPLWRLKKQLEPQWEAKEYELDQPQIAVAVEDLKIYGKSFLENDLKLFNEVRMLQNKERHSYSINMPTEEGFFKVDDLISKAFKKKYSK